MSDFNVAVSHKYESSSDRHFKWIEGRDPCGGCDWGIRWWELTNNESRSRREHRRKYIYCPLCMAKWFAKRRRLNGNE